MDAGMGALGFTLKAIDAYRKTLLVDKVTSDDEAPAPVVFLDEISTVLASCSLDLTKEIVKYAFRRLRRQSPQVKTKVLRFIEYTVNKAESSAYRRELQIHSIKIHELVKYGGEGTAARRAVQDAAQEAIKAIFHTDKSFSGKSIQIEGFGSGDFSNLSAASWRNSGGWRSYGGDSHESFGYSDCSGSLESHSVNVGFESKKNEQKNVEKDSFYQLNASLPIESSNCKQETKEIISNGELPRQIHQRNTESLKVIAPEERLLNGITAPNGSRLRPSEASLLSFLSSAKAHDAGRIAGALKAKLRSSSWKVRLRALSVFRAIVHQEKGTLLQAIKADGKEFHDFIYECLNFPQATLKKEAQEALEALLAMQQLNIDGKAGKDVVDDPCSQPFSTNLTAVNNKGFLISLPAVVLQNQLVDLLSFEVGELTCGPEVNRSPTSMPKNPFDGMCVGGSDDEPLIHMQDLLSETWVSTHSQMPSETRQLVSSTT